MTTTIENSADTAPARVEMTVPALRKSIRAKRSAVERAVPPARLPRVTRLMALAIKYQGMVSRGELADYADIARLGYITRARATQVMNLLHLAPDIQEELIFGAASRNPAEITERDLRLVAAAVYWKEQRKLWKVRLSTSATASETRSE